MNKYLFFLVAKNFKEENWNLVFTIKYKLLYSIIWKNGDLLKVKHIIQGILESEIENVDNNDKEFVEKQDSLVFYQFGKYLTKKNNEPIIDQHVVRAFAVSRNGRKINLDIE